MSIAFVVCTIDAQRVPALATADGVHGTYRIAAQFGVAARRWVGGETATKTVHTRSKKPADRRNRARAESIPLEKAAKRILLTNPLAARCILAARCSVGGETSSVSWAADIEPVNKAVCQFRACVIPLCITAERIDGADQPAGIAVLTTGRPVVNKAVPRPRPTGVEPVVGVALAEEGDQPISLTTLIPADANHVRCPCQHRKHHPRSRPHLSAVVVTAPDGSGGGACTAVIDRHLRVIITSAQAGDNDLVARRRVAEPDVRSHLCVTEKITSDGLVRSVRGSTDVAEPCSPARYGGGSGAVIRCRTTRSVRW